MIARNEAIRNYIRNLLKNYLVLDVYDEKRMPFVLIESDKEMWKINEVEGEPLQNIFNVEHTFWVFWYGRFSKNDIQSGEARKIVSAIEDDIIYSLSLQASASLETQHGIIHLDSIRVNSVNTSGIDPETTIGSIFFDLLVFYSYVQQ